jgi:hypothetical protein
LEKIFANEGSLIHLWFGELRKLGSNGPKNLVVLVEKVFILFLQKCTTVETLFSEIKMPMLVYVM